MAHLCGDTESRQVQRHRGWSAWSAEWPGMARNICAGAKNSIPLMQALLPDADEMNQFQNSRIRSAAMFRGWVCPRYKLNQRAVGILAYGADMEVVGLDVVRGDQRLSLSLSRRLFLPLIPPWAPVSSRLYLSLDRSARAWDGKRWCPLHGVVPVDRSRAVGELKSAGR
jgi:hypothetical protein